MPLAAGQTLSFYEILGPLGAGGMGEVYRAQDTRLDREVAIKVLPQDFAADEDRLRRFEREAKTLASLNHPNVAGIHGVDQEGETYFLALELVPGEDLATRLARGPLPVDEAIEVCGQIAEGLEAAHEAGIVHRDLKPANVRVTPDGAVKILDFGLAKPMHPGTSGETTVTAGSDSVLLTKEGMVLGTPAYMSPEQARGKTVDRRTDVWAFGCLLYECLTGQRAFRAESVPALLAAILHDEPDMALLPAATPTPVRRLLERSLVKDPHERLRDVGDARIELSVAFTTPGVDETREPTSARRTVPVAAASLVVGALIVLAATVDRSPPSGEALLRLDLGAPEGTSYHLFGRGPGPAALSPDGTRVAFTAFSGGESRAIWVRNLDEPQARRMPGTEGADYPFWSPDGEHLGFFASNRLQRIALIGGPAQFLADADEGKGGAWSSTGWIVFTRSSYDAIQAVRDTGGEVRTLTDIEAAPACESHRLPCFLPDGERFLFLARDAVGGSVETPHAVFVGSLDGDKPRFVMWSASHARYVEGHLVYAYRDSILARGFDLSTAEFIGEPTVLADDVGSISGAALALFSASRDRIAFHPGTVGNATSLVRYDHEGLELEAIATPQVARTLAVSPSGEHIATTLVDKTGKRDIWLYDQNVESWSRLTMGGDTLSPVWLPGGDELLFADLRGVQRLSIRSSGEPARVLAQESCIPSDVSSDGRLLVFSRSSPAHGSDLFVVPLDGSEEPSPLVEGREDDYGALLSPDGNWLGYTSMVRGASHVYVQPFPEVGRRFQVSESGVFTGWHPDGDRLYFVESGLRLIEVQVTAGASSFGLGASRTLLDLAGQPAFPGIGIQRDSVVIVRREPFGRGAEIVRIVLGWRSLLGN